MSIKLLAEDDRPREKFLLKGKSALSDSELLAIIINSGSRDETVVELAQRILEAVGNNWHNLSLLSLQDLMKFKGIGQAKAISISVALEIGRRKSAQEVPQKIEISKSQDAFKVFHPLLADLLTEEFWVIFLNQKNKILGKSKLSTGGINFSLVDLRVLFKQALEYSCSAIMIAHNHPSGTLRPSEADLKITKQISDAGRILNIQLLDHLIITQSSYFSFADENLL